MPKSKKPTAGERNQTKTTKPGGKKAALKGMRKPHLRAGEMPVRVENSGLEAWLYDENFRVPLKKSGALDFRSDEGPAKFVQATGKGQVVGYSLYQDDPLSISVIVGKPLTNKELKCARWQKPQTAYLHLPSGRLRIESNDASRIGPEKPTAKGASVQVPPGKYRLTLYRIDGEALTRDDIAWDGPQEVVVLTKGGTEKDAVDDLIPYEATRDLSWVKQYKLSGKKAEGLIWFEDCWDTFVFNLDSQAVSKLKIDPGNYLRIQVPSLPLTLVSVIGSSWKEAQKFRPPEGLDLTEYGVCALTPLQSWNGTQALFGRREKAKTAIPEAQHYRWHPATLEVLEVAASQPKRLANELLNSSMFSYEQTSLTEKEYFDSGFLAMVLGDLLQDDDRDELELKDAISECDAALKKLGLTARGDFSYQRNGDRPTERTCRVYTGRADLFALIRAAEGAFELFFLSEGHGEAWVLTGLLDDIETELARSGNSIELSSIDESIASIFRSHQKRIKDRSIVCSPSSLEEGLAVFDRLLKAIVG